MAKSNGLAKTRVSLITYNYIYIYTYFRVERSTPSKLNIHPGRFTWSPKMEVSKMILLMSIFRDVDTQSSKEIPFSSWYPFVSVH